jgi:hypothetical protein
LFDVESKVGAVTGDSMHRTSGTWLVILVMASMVYAGPAHPRSVIQTSDSVSSEPNLEHEKLAIEREKLGIEELKGFAIAVSIFIPLLVGFFTLHSQAKSARELKEAEAKSAFELKAAELVLAAYSPHAARGRARILKSLFKHRLPDEFAESFRIEDFPGVRLYEMQVELLRELAEHPPERRQEILGSWKQIFSNEKWLNNMT